MDDDWDLQAVVRSCSRITSASTSTANSCWYSAQEERNKEQEQEPQNNRVVYLPDLYVPQIDAVEELEQLYKPFLPESQQPISPLTNLITPNPVISQIKHEQQHHLHHHQHQHQHQPQQQQQQTRRTSTTSSIRPKRRKNQQKKVVCQVPAEGLSSDMWAWRKYGQKPIKGSPYPRGYYRCSSSKGCLARKQVERSRTDPGMFIITYTAEHNHPVPTHRNSLAGSTRHKLSSPQTPTTPSTVTATAKPALSSSPLGLSPITPLTMEDEEDERLSKGEAEEDDDDLGISQFQELIGDGLFMELDEFMGPTSSAQVPAVDDSFASHWFPPAAPSATAAGGV